MTRTRPSDGSLDPPVSTAAPTADLPVTDRITVLLVDDHALVRSGLRRLLEDDPEIVVVGEAGDGAAAIRLAASLRPHVILMDCAMPGAGGVTATRAILEQWPDMAILMLSMYGEAALVQQALGAGARGYILKDARDVDLPTAVKQATSGTLVLDPVASVAADRARTCGLSARQLEVLQLLCEGLTNQAIAERLAISANTVAVHRARIMKRLGTHSAGALVAYAIRHGLVHAR